MANQVFDFCMRMLNPFIQNLVNFKNHLIRDNLTRNDIEKQKLLRKFIEAFDRLSRNPDLTIQDVMNMNMGRMLNNTMNDDIDMGINQYRQNFRQQFGCNDDEYKKILEIIKGTSPKKNEQKTEQKTEQKIEQKTDQKKEQNILSQDELEERKYKEIVNTSLTRELLINTKLQKLKYVCIESVQLSDNVVGNNDDEDEDDEEEYNGDDSSDNNENMDTSDTQSGAHDNHSRQISSPLSIEVIPNIS